jgi:2-hydroxy-6-oxonona-2,4-dienedioate hydrolase
MSTETAAITGPVAEAPLTIWGELMGLPFSQRFVDAGGVSTRVIEAGEGPVLVLLHGTSGHAEAYARNIRDLSREFRVVAYDMVGHGFSAKPNMPYTIDLYSDHLGDLLDALGIGVCSLSGESLGAWVAAWFAAAHPERVERLVLNTPGNVTMKPEVMKTIRESTLRAVREGTIEAVRPRMEWLMADANRNLVTDELVAARTAIYRQPEFQQAVENILVLQDPEVRGRYTYDPAWCARIEAPTMIIWTTDDPTGSFGEGELLAEWIPGAELMLMTGAGHWPQWERPEEFLRVHLEFLLTPSR